MKRISSEERKINEEIMKKIKSQLRLIGSNLAESTRLTDTSGNPSESYYWGHMMAVRREWRYWIGQPYVNALEPTLIEILSAEMRVREELYHGRRRQS